MELTYKQKLWVQSRGGRSEKDVFIQNGKLILYMSTYDQKGYVEIPDNKDIHMMMNRWGYIKDSDRC